MKTQTTHFYSDGIKLEGYFYTADDSPDNDKPVIVVCSGFTGLADIHPERFARTYTKKGYTCFAFDYRGFAKSEGNVGQVLLDEQIRDIANAIEYVANSDLAKNRKIVLAGWGMAGGMVLKVPLLTNKVALLVAMNGFYDNVRVQKAVRGEKGFAQFQQWLNQQRKTAVAGSFSANLDPFDIYPLDSVSKEYVDNVLRKNPDYGLTCSISFADSLLAFSAESGLENISHIPLLIAHGAKNALHPVVEAESIYKKYQGKKELFLLENAGHTEWMHDDSPLFIEFSNTIETWINANT